MKTKNTSRLAGLKVRRGKDSAPAGQSDQLDEELFRCIFQDLPVGTVIISPNGRFTRANAAYCEFIGYSQRQLLGKTVESITHPGDRKSTRAAIYRSTSIGTSIHRMEKRYLHKSGRTVWGEVSNCLVRDADGKLAYVIGQVLNITARKGIEEKLHESEHKSRSLLETMNEGVVIVNTKMQMTFINDSFCRMVGYSRRELLNRPGTILLDSKNRQVAREQLRRRARGVFVPYELGFTRKNGRRRWGLVSAAAILDSGGAFTGSMSVVTDITELKDTQEAILKIQAQLETRVRQRTAELHSSNARLLREIDVRKQAEETLRIARAKALTAREEERKRLSSELHDSIAQKVFGASLKLAAAADSEAAAAHPSLRKSLISASDGLRSAMKEMRQVSHALYPAALGGLGLYSVLKQLQTELSSPGVKITVRCPRRTRRDGLSPVMEVNLFRIAQQALLNAVQHGMATRVDMSLAYWRGRIRLRVADNGTGFDPDKVRGKGLGLALMRDRADAIGATFSINSNRSGTCVEVTLAAGSRRDT